MVMDWRAKWKCELLCPQLEVNTWIKNSGGSDQSWEEANTFFDLWLAARGYSFETGFDVPWSRLWDHDELFKGVLKDCLPCHDRVLPVFGGYAGEKPWRYKHLEYQRPGWMNCAVEDGEYLLRFHGLHGYAFSSCLATGVLEPSEVKESGAAVVGEPTSGSTAACGRGVYTSADVAKAAKYAYGTVLGLGDSEQPGTLSTNSRATRIVLLVGIRGKEGPKAKAGGLRAGQVSGEPGIPGGELPWTTIGNNDEEASANVWVAGFFITTSQASPSRITASAIRASPSPS